MAAPSMNATPERNVRVERNVTVGQSATGGQNGKERSASAEGATISFDPPSRR
jgi:hypothetical protein